MSDAETKPDAGAAAEPTPPAQPKPNPYPHGAVYKQPTHWEERALMNAHAKAQKDLERASARLRHAIAEEHKLAVKLHQRGLLVPVPPPVAAAEPST